MDVISVDTFMRLQEDSSDPKFYWYLNDSLNYDGVALWLLKSGSYRKCHYSSVQMMTVDEAERALDILNNRLPRPATMMDFLPEWN